MSKEDIVNRLISDAESEAADIVKAASARADEIIAAAEKRALLERSEAEAEVGGRAKRYADGRAAAARLDSAKILLAEKRRVIEQIYSNALQNCWRSARVNRLRSLRGCWRRTPRMATK